MQVSEHKARPTLEDLRRQEQAFKALPKKEQTRILKAKEDLASWIQAFGGEEIDV